MTADHDRSDNAENKHTVSDQPEPVPDLPSVSFGPHFEMHPIVFPAGAAIVLALVALAFALPGDDLTRSFEGVRDWIGTTFGWLYVAALTGFLVFAIWLALGKYGAVPLGPDGEKPEFGRLTWFAMLFSAGMGIGLVFWSVAEPIEHFNTTPPGFAEGLDPSRIAMAVTIFHWGLHPWALYAVVALALAYFAFRRGMPLGFRSLLYPLLGERVWGPLGDAIDTLAIIATLTGVATSLGLGAQQVNAGFAFLFGMPIGTTPQVILIACITAVATVSVVLGLGTGIRRLSELNMGLAALLMLTVILGSGVIAFLGAMVENTGAYLQLLPFSSFRTGSINPDGRAWLNSWTVFYWAWWISWSPFVGTFIARISRGRTIREFVVGTLLVPTAVGIVWLTAFGATTLRNDVIHQDATTAFEAGEIREDPDTTVNRYTVALPAEETGSSQTEASPNAENTTGDQPEAAQAETAESQIATESISTEQVPTEQVPLTAAEYLAAPIVDGDSGERFQYQDKLATVLFVLLENTFGDSPIAVIAIGIATTCIILFFVTSSDSASMVIDIIASGGNPDPPVGTRLFWAITEGLVAAALLVAGGLEALQAASITAALPFTIILVLAAWSLTRALAKHEQPQPLITRAPRSAAEPTPAEAE